MNNEKPMMKCGHAANARVTNTGAPCCVICAPSKESMEIDTAAPSLEGRTATCAYSHHKPVPSSTGLAFFEHRPAKPTDQYYCGCHGWD